jgi:hypothetical protein
MWAIECFISALSLLGREITHPMADHKEILLSVEGQRLVLEKREAVLRRLLQRFERVPAEVSLADELIAERRAGGREEKR